MMAKSNEPLTYESHLAESGKKQLTKSTQFWYHKGIKTEVSNKAINENIKVKMTM